jgi:hypothetical protein
MKLGLYLGMTLEKSQKSAKKVLSLNGTSNYLQLPSFMMDTIEIECIIDNVQTDTDPCLIDARTGIGVGYFAKNENLGSGWTALMVDGIDKPNKLWTDVPKGLKTLIKLSANQFTDDVTIGTNYIFQSGFFVKVFLYSITCYLSSVVVAKYDFSKGTVQDQSGNGKNATLVGGNFVDI